MRLPIGKILGKIAKVATLLAAIWKIVKGKKKSERR